eukprot:2996307-Rhodomonas_salina.1
MVLEQTGGGVVQGLASATNHGDLAGEICPGSRRAPQATMSPDWESADCGEQQEWLDNLEKEQCVFDNLGRRLWTSRYEHSLIAPGRKE